MERRRYPKLFAALPGEKLPANVDPKGDNGPDKMTSKADIMKYLQDSFAMGHRAMNTLSESNVTERVASPEGTAPDRPAWEPPASPCGTASITTARWWSTCG
jgi:hypothetical protein